jgi:hypothetical protein
MRKDKKEELKELFLLLACRRKTLFIPECDTSGRGRIALSGRLF